MNVATDTCIVINLLRVNRLDLLGALGPYVFHVPREVVEEIEYPDQQQAVQMAIQQGWIHQTRLEDPLELQTFVRATAQLGKGESACIALAETRNWVLGTDDSKGAKWKKVISVPGIQILNTPGIILLAIRKGAITIQQADEIKKTLEENRFRMGFSSFQDLV
jgi:predicted nucleic acid-binding protein